MRKLLLFPFFLLLLLAGPAIPKAAAQGSWQWGRGNTGGGIDSWAITTDPSGNVYGGGTASGAGVDFGSGVTLPSGVQSVWIKYSPAGTPLWAGGASGNTYIYNLTTDAAGNLIAFGCFTGPSMSIGSVSVTSSVGGATSRHYYLAKISPTGTVLWAIGDGNGLSYGTSASGVGLYASGGVCTDAAGNIYITSCYSIGTMVLNGTTTLTNAVAAGTSSDIFVAKYTSGGSFLWATSVGGNKNDNSYGIGVTTTGKVYICGAYLSPSLTIGSSTLTNTSTLSRTCAFLASFNGTTGAPIWAQGAGGNNGAFASGMKIDASNNVYMTGGFADPTISFGSTTLSPPYPLTGLRMSLFLVKYSPSNVVTFSKTIGSPTQTLYGFGVALASCGQIWVTGKYGENANIDGATLTYVTGPDPIFIAGYNLSGGVVAYSGLSSGSDDQNGIAADAAGNIYTCSDYELGAMTIGPDVLPSLSGEHFYMAKYAVAPPDTMTAVKDTSLVCGFTSATLTASPGYSAWVWDDGTTTQTRTITSPGTYYVYNITCSLPVLIDTFHVSVIPADTTFTHQDTSVCTGIGSATLTAPAGFTTYTWSTGATTSSIVATTPGDYIVNCLATCNRLVDTFHFTYTPNDSSFYRHDTSVCAILSPITLSGPGGYSTFIWNTGATTSSISPATSGLYVRYATTNCTTRVDTFRLTYNPMPSVSLGNDTGLCVGDTLVLSSAQPAGNTYLWNTGATGSSITASATGSYWLQVTNSYGCITTDTIHITVSSLPVVNLGPDTTSCNGSPVTLQSSVTYPATTTYLWSSGSTASSYVATATGTYWLQVSNFGCRAADTIHVAIVFDTLTLKTGNTAICIGASVTVNATGDPGIHCQWTPTAGIPVSNIMTPTITPDTSATYILTASYPGCPDIIDSFHIDVQPYPTVYLGGNKFVCANDTLHIHASVTPSWYLHYSYHWSPGQYFDDSTNADVSYTPGDTMKIFTYVATPAGCKGSDSATIYVYPANFAHMDTTIRVCPHDSVQLKPTSTDDLATYRWHPSMYISDTTAAQPWVKAITSQAYTCIATSQHGCLDTVHASVLVSPTGLIYLGDDVTIYDGESYQLSPQTNCTSVYWTPAAGLTDPYIVNPVAMPYVNTMYILHGTTEWGCPATDSINIYLGDDILGVPNAFTPGTGVNNTFKVVKRGLVRLNYMRIFNRWGNLVYETTDIDKGWDGTYNGTPQPLGVFVYQLEAVTGSGRVVEQHGNVTLLR